MKACEELRVAIYCRVAREDQDAIDSQEKRLRAYAEQEGYHRLSCYADNGFSGLSFERPAFQRLVDDIQAGCVDAVMVHGPDRISRNMFDAVHWIDSLEKQGVSFISAATPYMKTPGLDVFRQALEAEARKRRRGRQRQKVV